MGNLKIFENAEFGKVRVVMNGGEPMFCMSDVASALEYANPAKAVIDHCKGVTVLNTPTQGGVQKIKYGNGDEVITLIEKSKTKTSNKKKQIVEWLGLDVNNIVCCERFETAFGKQLIETLTPLCIEVETQKFVCGKYRIDFYLPKYKLAVEYDEQQHQFQHEADNQRMEDIKKELGCKFVRLGYKNTDATNVGIVLSNIFNK